MAARPGSPPTPRDGLQEELRRNNLSALLTRVHVHGPTSRAALTRELGLNRSTIGDLAAELEELGLVTERQPAVVRRSGRPSFVLEPARDNVAVAVDIGVDRIVTALVGAGGEVLHQRQRPRPGRARRRARHRVGGPDGRGGARRAPGVRCLGHRRLRARCGPRHRRLGAVRAEPRAGSTSRSPSCSRERLGRRSFTGNDANLGVLAEHLRGAAVGHSDVGYLNGSVGIGGGFLVGGVPLHGRQRVRRRGRAPAGRRQQHAQCRCGNVGCWETKVGENQLLILAGRLPGGGPRGSPR